MNQTQSESVHGHEVMHLLTDFGPLNRANLRAKVFEHFGPSPQFHTCSASGMDLDQLLEFLLARAKINEGPSGFFMGEHQHICEHE